MMKIHIQIYKVSNHNLSQLKHHNHDILSLELSLASTQIRTGSDEHTRI